MHTVALLYGVLYNNLSKHKAACILAYLDSQNIRRKCMIQQHQFKQIKSPEKRTHLALTPHKGRCSIYLPQRYGRLSWPRQLLTEETVTCIKVLEFGEQNAASTFQRHSDEGIMSITQQTRLHTSAAIASQWCTTSTTCMSLNNRYFSASVAAFVFASFLLRALAVGYSTTDHHIKCRSEIPVSCQFNMQWPCSNVMSIAILAEAAFAFFYCNCLK